MKRVAAVLCLVMLASGLFWYFPLFHIVRNQDGAKVSDEQPQFDAARFAAGFWSQQLLPALDKAVDASAVLEDLSETTPRARRYVGRKVGMSRSRIYLVKGRGQIVSVEKEGVGVSLDGDAANPDIVLQTGFLFGNVVRDATGLLEAGDYAHSQDFNDISTELNRIVEDQVIAKLKQNAKVGQQINFVGCVEVSDAADAPKPLILIPLKVGSE